VPTTIPAVPGPYGWEIPVGVTLSDAYALLEPLLPPNLVPNGDFETNTAGWSAIGGAALARDTAQAVVGSASLLVTPGAGLDSGGDCYLGASSLAANARYRATVYLRGTPGKSVRIVLNEFNGSFSLLASHQLVCPLTATWTAHSLNLTTSAAANRGSLVLVSNVAATGPFNADIARVVRVP